jgi:hypothetical protein
MVFNFPDWTVEDCAEFYKIQSSRENFSLDPEAEGMLREGLDTLLKLEGWGNARDVVQLWKSSKDHRADRLSMSDDFDKVITASDVEGALGAMLAGRRPRHTGPKNKFSSGSGADQVGQVFTF